MCSQALLSLPLDDAPTCLDLVLPFSPWLKMCFHMLPEAKPLQPFISATCRRPWHHPMFPALYPIFTLLPVSVHKVQLPWAQHGGDFLWWVFLSILCTLVSLLCARSLDFLWSILITPAQFYKLPSFADVKEGIWVVLFVVHLMALVQHWAHIDLNYFYIN